MNGTAKARWARAASWVLAAAVLGILVTAPLGAIGIDASYRRLLTRTTEERTGEQ